ncbi:MAG TPA: lysophospholipid acyltransferase family protein [Methylomirabilota bacterium]|nr:lysophospholipid acyltransferase family protein [Methylomirabilota bacterium]
MGPRLIRALVRALLAIFYRRVDVVGLERVPAAGGLIVAANHQNGLVDPMMLMARLPRTLQPLTKSTLFKHPIVAPFLHLAHAVPIYRRQDAGGAAVDNAETFRAVSHVLATGGAILIFPEGVSQPEPTLMALRTGAARMLLEAEAAGAPPVTLLPIGLVLHEPGTFRDGRGLILVGDPVETEDCGALHRTDPVAAVHQLTDRLAEALKKLIVEAEDRDTLRLLRLMERVWREETHVAPTAASAEWLQRASRAYRWLRREAPADVQRFRCEVEEYADKLDELGITPATVGRAYAPSIVTRYAAREIVPLVLGLPLAVLGIVLHALPYALLWIGVRLARPSADTEATYKLLGGVIIYPLAWIFQAWLAWRSGGGWALALYLLLLLPAGFFALAWQARLDRVRGEARALGHFLARRGLHARLIARRRELAEQLDALARRVPEPVLSGRTS